MTGKKGGDWRRRLNGNDLKKGGDWRQDPSTMVGEEKEKDETARFLKEQGKGSKSFF